MAAACSALEAKRSSAAPPQRENFPRELSPVVQPLVQLQRAMPEQRRAVLHSAHR
jgi:hypothetical protein